MKQWLVFLLCLSLGCSLTSVDDAPTDPDVAETMERFGSSNIRFYLIAPEDNGISGTPVGCGDSIVAVSAEKAVTGNLQNNLRAALESLFSLEEENYGRAGLITNLHTTNMQVESISVEGNSVTINLEGIFSLVGVCSDARMQAQILHTIFQFPQVNRAAVYINGENMKQLFDMRGVELDDAPYTRDDL